MAETVKIVRCDHPLVDSGEHFTVDIQTRSISHPNPKSLVLVQGDANSEIYTIRIPKLIDNHPVDVCNKLEIHYINAGSNSEVLEDICEIAELKEYPDDSENLYAEWILSGNTSMYNGNLSFAMRFMCVADDEAGTILYSWSTLPFTGISIGRTILNAETVYIQYSDIIAQWYQKLTGASNSLDTKIDAKVNAAELAIDTKVSAAKLAIEEKGKVIAGSLSEQYKEYGAESYIYYLNFIMNSCYSGAGSLIIVRGIPISARDIGELRYVHLYSHSTSDSDRTLEVYIGDNDYPDKNDQFISGYASCEWYGDESLPDLEIKFSIQVDRFIDSVNNETLTVEIGHACAYDPEPYIQGFTTLNLRYLDVSSWESYVESNGNPQPGSTIYIEDYFCIEKLKSVQPMIDQAMDRAKQYTDYQINNLDISNARLTDRETGEVYSIFIENGQLKIESYTEPYKEE